MTRKRDLDRMLKRIARFNADNPIGSKVIVTQDSGCRITTTLTASAKLLGGHTPVAWVDGISGAYALHRIRGVTEGPIIFTGEMVRAIYDGAKTETRRVVDPKIVSLLLEIEKVNGYLTWQCLDFDVRCPYDHDRLWVREKARLSSCGTNARHMVTWVDLHYAATDSMVGYQRNDYRPFKYTSWTPSIHMPRWASRLTLKVEKIKVERLRDIEKHPEQALDEGVAMRGDSTAAPFNAIDDFRALWDGINAKRGFGWATNPLVWVVRFSRYRED